MFSKNFLDENRASDVKQISGDSTPQIDLLKKSLEEQEMLIKGYQFENEKLYADLKDLKEENRRVMHKYEEEKQQLKYDLIQEKKEKQTVKSHVKSSEMANVDVSVPSKFMPLSDESVPKTGGVEAYEHRIRVLEHKLNDSQSKYNSLDAYNKELLVRVEYYEKHQHQIEQDIQIIDAKNKEIKNLSEKLRLLEINKTAPDYLKELRKAKNQLKEMDLLVSSVF